MVARSSIREDKESLACRKCKEVFHILSVQDDTGFTSYDGFLFSCNGIYVSNFYRSNVFFLGDNDQIFSGQSDPNPIKIPSFPINFSDKNKLYEKLKTYIIFY